MPSRLTRAILAASIIAATVIGAPQAASADPGGSGGSDDGGPVIVVGGGGFGSGIGEVDTGIGITTNQQSPPPGGQGGTAEDASAGQDAGGGQAGGDQQGGSSQPQTCIQVHPVTPSPPAADPRWNGADPTTHDLYTAYCAEAIVIPTDAFVRTWVFLIADKGKTPTLPPPPPNPADLATTVWAHMRTLIPAPGATTSPDLPHNTDATTGHPVTYVNLWMWFWTAATVWKPITQTLSQSGVTVTVTAAPDTLTFDPGNGDRPVTCAAPPGRPWTDSDGNTDPAAVNACGYRYTRLDTQGRTITATLSITWHVTWTSNTGTTGSLGPLATTTDTVPFVIEQLPVEVK